MFGLPGVAGLPQTTAMPTAGLQPIAYQPMTGTLPGIGAATGLVPGMTGPLGTAADAAAMVQKPTLGERLGNTSVVRAVKAALKELGLFKGSVNDTMDTKTKQSVLAFQKQEGLKETGSANAATRRALQKKIAAKSSKAKTAAAAKAAATAPAGTPVTPNGVAGLTGTVTPGTAVLPGAAGSLPASLSVGGTLPLGVAATPAQPTGPQMNATNQQGLTNNADGANQTVTNRNAHDASGLTVGDGYGSPYGYGYGSPYGAGYTGGLIGWNTTPGGLPMYPGANPYTAPGASMTGAYYTQPKTGVGGFFQRLFGG